MNIDAQSYINQYGGKAGAFYFLRDIGGFEQHMLPVVYVAADQDMSAVLAQFPKKFPSQIVRGTHPNDHEGFVDVLETKRARDQIGLEIAIETIREKAQHPDVFSYSSYEGQAYDGHVGIMIQPENLSKKRGSMVEHPHRRGVYLIDLVCGESYVNTIERIVVEGDKIDLSRVIDGERLSEETAKKIVDLYLRVRETGFICDDRSFQMEFGLNYSFNDKDEVLFYQARPFLPFAENTKSYFIDEYDCFGMTPPDGLVLPVVRTLHGEYVNEMQEPFALIWNDPIDQLPLTVQPRDLVAFIPISLRVNSLEHNTYRWLRKARVSILNHTYEYLLDHVRTGDHIRVWCDGLAYQVTKV